MAKAATAPAPKMTFAELKHMRLKTVDAMFYLAFGIVAIATVVAIGIR